MVHRYERLRHISTGRFGVAMLVKSGTYMAVMKTIDIGQLDGRMQNLVLSEVSELAQLRHPHLATVRECFMEGSSLCIVTEYAAGGHVGAALEKAFQTGADLGEPQVLGWFIQAALALKHLHDRNILHRDLRTRRLLLTLEGHIVLSCAPVSALLARSLAVERPDLEAVQYLSPELIDGQVQHTKESDIWALGLVLYEMICLQPAFDHDHPRALAEHIRSWHPKLPLRHSQELRDVCLAMLRFNPSSRLTMTQIFADPVVQRRLWSMLSDEPMNLPGSIGSKRRGMIDAKCANIEHKKLATTLPRVPPRPAELQKPCISGPMLLSSLAGTPRGLRRIGEQVAGCKVGGLQMGPRAELRRHCQRPDSGVGLQERVASADTQQRSTSGDLGSSDLVVLSERPTPTPTALVSRPASELMGEVVTSVLGDLDTEFTIQFEKEHVLLNAVTPSATGSSGCGWDLPPPVHTREFPQYT